MRPVIYLMRHGQTVWNALGRAQGQLDSPLTELGWAQAAAHAEHLARVPFVRAYASPLGRARLTAERVLEGRNVSLTLLDNLAELHWGELAGLLPDERAGRFPDVLAAREANKWTAVIPGGESYATAHPRAERAVQQILKGGPGEVLVVGHEMMNRLLRMELLGLSADEAMHLVHPHGAVYVIQNGTETTFC